MGSMFIWILFAYFDPNNQTAEFCDKFYKHPPVLEDAKYYFWPAFKSYLNLKLAYDAENEFINVFI